jgi:hypothetical protein
MFGCHRPRAANAPGTRLVIAEVFEANRERLNALLDQTRQKKMRTLPAVRHSMSVDKLSNIPPSDTDLERYYLGMVKDEAELAALESHLLGCPACANRAEAAERYVDVMRVALMRLGDP